jgi:beta-xylosidase
MKSESNSMMKLRVLAFFLIAAFCGACTGPSAQKARNPLIWADVPDVSVIRVEDTYYMSSTTMHMSPGLPIMKSANLVNWELVGYAYDTLADNDALTLRNGENAYGRGSWASSLRYHDGHFYVSTFSASSGKTHIFKTADIESGEWTETAFAPDLHDHSLFFEDGRVYMIYGGGDIRLVELTQDLSGIKTDGVNQVIIPDASAVAGDDIMLPAEGSQLRKINGKYYLLTITWPQDGMRTVLVHRADKLTGPYEGRVVLQDQGVAQGTLVDTPDGKWYALLFGDRGAVGRIPYLVPVKWKDNWPVFGVDGKVPEIVDIAVQNQNLSTIVTSDEFGGTNLPLAWQWNHNPDDSLWSLTDRSGYLRLTNGRIDSSFLQTRNTLTQRTFGPASTATISMDVSAMRDGDVAGLALLQKHYGYVGVVQQDSQRYITTVNAEGDSVQEKGHVPLAQDVVYLKVDADFRDLKDQAQFYFSLDAQTWKPLGKPLAMKYTLPHFMGYRFGLFNFATQTPGGHVDFDYFRVKPAAPFTKGPELPQ